MDVDTIVSLSSSAGVGAIAVVRMSGPRACAVLQALLPPGSELPEPRRVTLGEIHDPSDGELLDRALITRFTAPDSFTGEDVVELSCHGGWLVPALIVDACIQAGARQAAPGEFTRRAYLRGKVDLVQAEAIADLIDARSRALHRAAMGQLERGLSRRVSALRDRLLRLEALLAHHVDFPEEDDAPVPIAQVVAEAQALIGETDKILATAPEGELLREGALAVFAGRPNAGKSSLYNALIGQERAIVTEEPGTTRDALEATVQMGGFPFRLIDTAGLRESPGRIERLGIEIALDFLERADVILFCVPADEPLAGGDLAFLSERHRAPIVLVETKADLRAGSEISATPNETGPRIVGRVPVSVESGQGLGDLRTLLPELVYSSLVVASSDVPVLTRRRHTAALRTARKEVEAFWRGLVDGLPAEVASTHLRSAQTAFEELIGIVTVDDVLDVVFRDFCVGK